jgi:REP element-mobilizing transposase RayT
VLAAAVDGLLTEMIETKAREFRSGVLAVGVASDHVHVLLHQPPTLALAALVNRLKGFSSRECNLRRFTQERLEWQTGYWAESVSPNDVPRLLAYIHDQRAHHDAGLTESWSAFDGE